MNHQEKVDHYVDDLTGRGAWKSNVAPPLWQLFWKLGWEIRPPLFMGFVHVLLSIGLLATVLWGGIMWKLQWAEAGTSTARAVVVSVGFGLAFSASYAALMAWMRKKYSLTTWEEYPDA